MTAVHHVELTASPRLEKWGTHCLTCGAQTSGHACIEAAEDAATAHVQADLVERAERAIRWAVHLEGQLAAIREALHLDDDQPIDPPEPLDSGTPLYGWDLAVDDLRNRVRAVLS